MNCKPGDLAVVVRPLTYNPNALGMVVEVLQWIPSMLFKSGYEPAYGIRAPRPLKQFGGDWHREGWVRQSSLRPIRDPGDDATDETLTWLPVPGKAVTA